MPIAQWNQWPALVGLLVILVAAVLQSRTSRVPNALTEPAILVAWLLSAAISAHGGVDWAGGSLLGSLTGTALALIICLPVYRRGLGAGTIKAQMAFGAWVGCAMPFLPTVCITAIATLLGGVLTCVGCLVVIRRAEAGHGALEFPAQSTYALGAFCCVVGWFVLHLS
jgi:prepilin signal peptidase PulO-like enzyme (type II secretory pathway)